MTNKVTIKPTTFDSTEPGKYGRDLTYGFSIYNDYASIYSNLWESIPLNHMEILRLVVEESQENIEIETMLDSVRENESGLQIYDTYYDWNQIKDILSEEEGV
jgi:hypothetical protein